MVGVRLNIALFVRACVFILLLGFVSAVDVDFDCPDEIFVDEEFECSLEVFDGDGVYDVKVELDLERDSVLKIWDEDGGEWLSGYYYLREFVEDGDEVDVRLKVSEAGRYDGVLKLRQGDKREFFEIERIVVRESVDDVEYVDDGVIVLGEEAEEVVVLNVALDGHDSGEPEVVYESRDSKVVDNLVYGFAVFLIFVIGILVWERR